MEKLIKKNNAVLSVPVVDKKNKMAAIVKKESVKVCADSFKYNQALSSGSELAPVVTMRKKGDIIEAIEVICPCGNKIEILCQYD